MCRLWYRYTSSLVIHVTIVKRTFHYVQCQVISSIIIGTLNHLILTYNNQRTMPRAHLIHMTHTFANIAFSVSHLFSPHRLTKEQSLLLDFHNSTKCDPTVWRKECAKRFVYVFWPVSFQVFSVYISSKRPSRVKYLYTIHEESSSMDNLYIYCVLLFITFARLEYNCRIVEKFDACNKSRTYKTIMMRLFFIQDKHIILDKHTHRN